MMYLPSKKELEMYEELTPWFDYSGDLPAIKQDAPVAIKKMFAEWVSLTEKGYSLIS